MLGHLFACRVEPRARKSGAHHLSLISALLILFFCQLDSVPSKLPVYDAEGNHCPFDSVSDIPFEQPVRVLFTLNVVAKESGGFGTAAHLCALCIL